MKMKKKILLTFVVVFFIAYISSFFLIRQAFRQTAEIDGCPPPEGCIEIHFPANGFYNIYRPLIGLEIALSNTNFCNHNRGCSHTG